MDLQSLPTTRAGLSSVHPHLFIFVIVYIGRLHTGFRTNHLPQSSKNSCQLQKSNIQQLNSYFLGDVINKIDIFKIFFF
jgi:hypothetical protein